MVALNDCVCQHVGYCDGSCQHPEPVAYRYRWRIDGEWTSWRVSDASQKSKHLRDLEEIPLYLSSLPQAGVSEEIIAPAECDPSCDDPECPYSHQPLTLRQAYENAVSRLRAAEHDLSAARSALCSRVDAARSPVTAEMVNAAWNKGKDLRMTGLPSDFRRVLEAALSSQQATSGGGAGRRASLSIPESRRDHPGGWIGDWLEARPVVPATSQAKGGALPDDLFSHKAAWRRGFERLRNAASDEQDWSYWQHELDAFDRVYAALVPATSQAKGSE